MSNEQSHNKMETMPVPKLMISMGAPMVLSLLVQALYNIVDSAFVSNMPENGEAALNALTLVFPLQVLMIAIGIGTGVGANVLVSRFLGHGDRERANSVCGNAIFLGILIYILFILVGIAVVPAYISSQTSNELVMEMAVNYLRICMFVSFGNVFYNIFEKLLQAGGHPMYSTIAQISGAVLNMILDPFLIYGWCGLPKMGVTGAAIATIIGQILAGALAVIFHLKVNRVVSAHPRYWKPNGRLIRDIYAIGFPAIIAQALMSVMTYGLNIVLARISESMVTAYGLFYKIQQFVLFAAFGLRDAITPILSFNRGAGHHERMRSGIRFGLLYTSILMVAGVLIVECLAVPFQKMFGLSGETATLFLNAEHIITISFLFAGVNIAFQGIFQALDGGFESLLLSFSRQVVFIFPFACFFVWLVNRGSAGNSLVWFTFLIAEALSTIFAVILFRRIDRKKLPHALNS